MFIQTEETPNPATLKFLPGRAVVEDGTADFTSSEAAKARSPLAGRLFEVEGVSAVFFGRDFITITKSAEKEWHVMKPALLGAIMEHFTAGRPVMSEIAETVDAGGEEDTEVVQQIKE